MFFLFVCLFLATMFYSNLLDSNRQKYRLQVTELQFELALNRMGPFNLCNYRKVWGYMASGKME